MFNFRSGSHRGAGQFFSRSSLDHVYDVAGNVIETHEHAGDFREF
jgi:hypothetical protein